MIFPIEDGISQLNLFESKLRVPKFERIPIDAGMLPRSTNFLQVKYI